MSGNIPVNIFPTDEFPLVVALRTIGIPFADENCRMNNIYTEGFLRKIGKTAEEAQADGIPGDKQTWMFANTEEFQALYPIFRQIWDNNQDKEIDFPGVDLPTLFKIGVLFLKNRGPMAADFLNHKPKAAISRGTLGECTILTSKCTPEARAQMGIEG